MSLKLILVSKLGVGCPRFAYKLIRTVAVKQGGGIANKSNKQGKATTPQFWRGSKEVQCKNGNIASHKLPGKSSLNVSFACPVRPEDPGGYTQVPGSYGPVPGGYSITHTLSTDVGCDSGDWPAF